MLINADYAVRTLVHADELPWIPSPQTGVERRMLERVGGEVARATTIVRYAKGSSFTSHTHDMGEEYIVLEGVFQDEKGDHTVGRYVRNPPGSQHTPGSEQGAIIFVKLRQFDLHDRKSVEVDLSVAPKRLDAHQPGVLVQDLHSDAREIVRVEYWQRDQIWQENFAQGAELLVLQGQLQDSGDSLRSWSWLRLPAGASLRARIMSDSTTVWVKRYLNSA
jgi:hypothetical protein